MNSKHLDETIIIQKDGDMWCAIRNSFINLQESLAGFGNTVEEALTNLLKEENKNDNNK